MKHYLITWHETDGNDCTVFDTYVAADTEDGALGVLDNALHAACPEAEEGFDYLDMMFPCSCGEADAEFCEGHGGTVLRKIVEYASEQEARTARPFYHSLWELPT